MRNPSSTLWGRLAGLAGLGLLAATIGGSLGHWHWLLDLMSHFRVQYLLLAIVLLLPALLARNRVATVALSGALLWNGCLIAPYYTWRNEKGRPGGARVTLVALNVHTANPFKAKVVDYLRQSGAAIVGVTEVDDQWVSALDGLASLYGHRQSVPRDDNFGIALLSMWPWQRIEVVRHRATGIPSIVAHFNWSGNEFVVIVAHPVPPMGAEQTRMRNEDLAEIADICARWRPLPCVVIGDLNATPWSSVFRGLSRKGGLRDSALGFGVQFSWNAQRPWLRIPIDHILVPTSSRVEVRRVGPDVGSDHFPIEATVRLPRNRTAGR